MLNLPDRRTLLIYTDGSVNINNNGGVGVRIISIDDVGDEIINDSQRAGYKNITSSQIELIACIVALETVANLQMTASIHKIVILTDSKFVSENYKKAMFEWSKNKWNWKTGRPILDADLWKNLVKQLITYNRKHIYVDIKWVKGHSKDSHNIAVDKLAKKAANLPAEKIPKNSIIYAAQPRKVIPAPKIELGCVQMNGQKISIKILSSKLLKPQNIWSYKYLVTSPKSEFLGKVDKIFSDISLGVNKTYFVKFNSITTNPRIEKVYWEIKKS